MIAPHPYIQRKQTTKLARDIRDAIHNPQNSPLLFSVAGKDGIGKSTFLNKLVKFYSEIVSGISSQDADSPLLLSTPQLFFTLLLDFFQSIRAAS